MSRTRRSAWSVASGLVFTILTVSAELLATPWILYWLGSERFGTYKVLIDWMAYLSLLELGLGGALMACLAPKIAQGNISAVRGFLNAGLHDYLWVTLAMLLGGVGLVIALPYVIPPEAVGSHELRTAGLIYLLPFLLTPLFAFRWLAEARQRHYLFSLLLTMQIVLTTGLWFAAAWAGWGLPGQSLASAVGQVPMLLILMWDGRRT
ncbi:MAG: hypothetical protein GTO49_13960, partial [Anaerolineae bacterium]|nr:hypothetical protein [Anaerolineae bacterium]